MPFAGYEDFDDCVAKNSDKGDPKAYCGSIQAKVEEANRIYSKEQTPEQVASLTTPDAGDVPTEEPKDLTSPQGSSLEAQNDQASGDGETSPADPAQDQAEPEANPQDQAKPENGQVEDKLEYNGETYHKVKAIEYDNEIYVQKDEKEEASEDDLEFEDDIYKKADEETLELENDNDYFIKDNEQAPMDTDLSGGTATPAMDIPELNPIGESVIIRENGRYRKYNVFQANEQEDLPVRTDADYKAPEDEFKDERRDEHQASEQEEVPVEQPAEVPQQPPVVEPQPDVAEQPQEPQVQPIEQKVPSEEIRAVEKIIIKENGKLKFKKVFTEVKKKA